MTRMAIDVHPNSKCNNVICRGCLYEECKGKCPHPGCGKMVTKEEVQDCPRLIHTMLNELEVQCPHCATHLRREQLEHHDLTSCPRGCPNATDGCTYRGSQNSIKTHLAAECLYQPFPCVASHVDCKWKGKLEERKRHVTTCPYVALQGHLESLLAMNTKAPPPTPIPVPSNSNAWRYELKKHVGFPSISFFSTPCSSRDMDRNLSMPLIPPSYGVWQRYLTLTRTEMYFLDYLAAFSKFSCFDQQVRITYHGWNPTHDESLSLTSPRLAPLFSHTGIIILCVFPQIFNLYAKRILCCLGFLLGNTTDTDFEKRFWFWTSLKGISPTLLWRGS